MRPESKAYTASYYEENVDAPAFASASQIIPFLIKHLSPRSMLELGAGNGTWSRVALDLGITDLLAVDGSWIRPEGLRVPPEHFLSFNLHEPLHLSRSFDLAICLEVGEHLNEASADVLVDSLTKHAPVVVFGAAMPFQGGTSHINEQWPAYWREKFERRGYVVVDAIRPVFWNNPRVAYYYKQNTFIYLRSGAMTELASRLQTISEDGYRSSATLPFIHPEKYEELATLKNVNVKLMLKMAPKLLTRALRNKLARFFERSST